MSKPHSVSCVDNGTPSLRRLSGAEAVVIIVIITVAALLVSVAGMTLPLVLQLLSGAGSTAVVLVCLLTGIPGRGFRKALRAFLTASA
ncbi:hypothetical protein B0675_39450 [Streptomyces sp. M41(2017)]|uniref:hypothetical protein n=1 Tax=Streptomyces sp. M41(2017) TaxID=1955065 RepID=UPI0009BF04F8|nr:hypothetical protein [Streptomyces sp. M41(2017)]OQQ13108.1 hypothetical protein B0675_39450 [Streptomyces sp. M41(2017)]